MCSTLTRVFNNTHVVFLLIMEMFSQFSRGGTSKAENAPCDESWLKDGNMAVQALSEYSEVEHKWSASSLLSHILIHGFFLKIKKMAHMKPSIIQTYYWSNPLFTLGFFPSELVRPDKHRVYHREILMGNHCSSLCLKEQKWGDLWRRKARALTLQFLNLHVLWHFTLLVIAWLSAHCEACLLNSPWGFHAWLSPWGETVEVLRWTRFLV